MTTRKEFFAWQDDYGVNIQPLDKQHQALVSLLNVLFVAAFERRENKIIVDMLQALRRSFRMHFELEERLLRQMAHKDVDAHQHENRQFLAQLDHLCRKHEQLDMPVNFDMLYLIKYWLADHFQIVDSGDLVKVGYSAHAWEQSANEAFDSMPCATPCGGGRKAA